MQKTAIYDTYRGERILRKFDSLPIDRIATMKAAMDVVDASDVIEAAKRVQAIVDNEGGAEQYVEAARKFERLKKQYQLDCQRHAYKNPVHFEPRRNEVLL